MKKKILNYLINRGYVVNHIEKIAEYQNSNIYSPSLFDKDGMALPIGLPVLVLERTGKFSIVEGDDALSLLDKIK